MRCGGGCAGNASVNNMHACVTLCSTDLKDWGVLIMRFSVSSHTSLTDWHVTHACCRQLRIRSGRASGSPVSTLFRCDMTMAQAK